MNGIQASGDIQNNSNMVRPRKLKPSPFFLVFGCLCAMNAVVLLACWLKQSTCLAVLPFNWPALFVLPDEADELLGIGRVVVISWFVALPWLGVVSTFIVESFGLERSSKL